MKIAVCISGGIRYPHLGLKSIQNIIPNENVKIFIHTWKIDDLQSFKDTLFSTQYKEENNKYIETNLNSISEYNYTKLLLEDYESKKNQFESLYKSLPSRLHQESTWCNEYEQGITLPRKDVGPISMHYSIYKSNELKRQYEYENNMIFDYVIRMRFDSDFCGKILDLNQFSKYLYIPEGEDYCAGINDQFAFGPSIMMDVYSNLYNNILKMEDCTYQPECMLNKYINAMKIPLKRFPFQIIINNGIDFRKALFSNS